MIVIVIPAKGKSGRLPNKNMLAVNGRPMIDYTIDDALKSRRADRIYVSTDSDAIATHAAGRGIPVIRRPESLGGDVPILDVYRHAIANMEGGDGVDVLVGLQPDHPDRDIGVDESLAVFFENGVDRVMSKQADGTKNGAHYVLSRHFLDSGESRKDVTIVDDCTNIHYEDEVRRAEERLALRAG